MDIIIDTKGQESLKTVKTLVESDDDLDFDDHDFEILKDFDFKPKESVKKTPKSNDIDLDDLEDAMGWNEKNEKKKKSKRLDMPIDVSDLVGNIDSTSKVLEKSAIVPGFEQLETVPRYSVGKRSQQTQNRKERAKTKGKNWFNLPLTEMTPEIKHDLQVIQMRSVLDPKRFYKKNDIKALPKYFQIGKIMDSPVDFYSSRVTNKERKKTIVDELMENAEFSKYNKAKYAEIVKNKKMKQGKKNRKNKH